MSNAGEEAEMGGDGQCWQLPVTIPEVSSRVWQTPPKVKRSFSTWWHPPSGWIIDNDHLPPRVPIP